MLEATNTAPVVVWALRVIGMRQKERTVPVSGPVIAALRAHWQDTGRNFDGLGVRGPLIGPILMNDTPASIARHMANPAETGRVPYAPYAPNTMTQKQKKRKTTKRAMPLSREDLLPIAPSIAKSISLKNHMALAVLKTAQGNLELAGELLKTLYWAFYLSGSEEVSARKENFIAAERSLKACIIRARDTGQWKIAEVDAHHMEVILQLHDEQLASMPVYQLERAKQRLARLIDKNQGFPSFAIERGPLK